jgi:[ribosomal protein S5]-alanine N-acetyltransferase
VTMPIPTLTTDRLVLRSLVDEDAEVLHQIYQVEGVLRYFPSPYPPPLAKVQKFIQNQSSHWEEHGYGNWALVPKDSNQLIGWAGPQFLPETGETEIGYLLARPFWGLGYATEAARASLGFIFGNFDFPKIIALVHPENTASAHVLEKCGLALLDRKEYFGMQMCRYTIGREEFMKAATRSNA